ncbi:hypothetical protein EDD27_9116 [Nonomuraea polychroma]|uniref:Uncharacterized protein n=1 Tax=Nonomuraea polychroma TaxID=46176 RepID=A0A438MKM9_9ACTN|nr:hypothetical protein [Nonomuraea polychroma]RVX46251.1 hypothetical protein EDD27_9116 [Nonomuraea polychroma]
MSWLPLIIAALLGVTLLVGYAMVLVGIRREDKALSLRQRPNGASASLARKVTGCYARNGVSWT